MDKQGKYTLQNLSHKELALNSTLLLLSLRNSERQDQVREFCAGLVQAQCRHLDIKTLSALMDNFRNTNQKHWSLICPCSSTAGRQSISMLHKHAWQYTKPLTEVPDHCAYARACGYPCVRVFSYYIWLLAHSQQNALNSGFRASPQPLQTYPNHLTLLHVGLLCLGPQEITATGHITLACEGCFWLLHSFARPSIHSVKYVSSHL